MRALNAVVFALVAIIAFGPAQARAARNSGCQAPATRRTVTGTFAMV